MEVVTPLWEGANEGRKAPSTLDNLPFAATIEEGCGFRGPIGDWASKTKAFLLDLTCILLLVLTIAALLWEHIRHLFR